MTEENLHDDIGELADEIECSIAEAKGRTEKWDSEFDSTYRRMKNANVDVGKLFG